MDFSFDCPGPSSTHLDHFRAASKATTLRQVAVDNVDKGRLQACTTDEETVNVGLLAELLAVLLAYTAAVQDAGLIRGLVVDLLLEPLADGGVDLLRLLG